MASCLLLMLTFTTCLAQSRKGKRGWNTRGCTAQAADDFFG